MKPQMNTDKIKCTNHFSSVCICVHLWFLSFRKNFVPPVARQRAGVVPTCLWKSVMTVTHIRVADVGRDAFDRPIAVEQQLLGGAQANFN